jgi:23S rRNA (pseudouridine1915-N3)-methyltransferase
MSVLRTKIQILGVMMQIRILAVGKVKEDYLQKGIAEYLKRLRPYARIEVEEVTDEPLDAGLKRAPEREGERLLKRIKDDEYLVVLDRQGRMFPSEELAQMTLDWEMTGKKVVFIIGGAAGLSSGVVQRADLKLSFSKLTFPHQLFRLILVEQIYRAFKIARGEPYHH